MKPLKQRPFRADANLRKLARDFTAPLRRENLIRFGVLLPGGFWRGEPKPEGWPMRACDGPVLRLDDAGKSAAQRHMRQGHYGAIELPAPVDGRIE